METPSSMRTATGSQAPAAAQKIKQEDTLLKPRTTDRAALLDVSNDSPIVGLAASSLAEKTPSSFAAKNRVGATPGSGESLLRGQVKTLLQKVEEETVGVGCVSSADRPPLRVTLGMPVYSGHNLAPTPANTPQIITSEVVEELKQEELQVINRVLFDSPGKSEVSEESVVTRSGGERSVADDSSSGWSLQVNTSIKEDDKDVEDEYQEEDGECFDDLCDILTNMSVQEKARLPEFVGKHTRFIYDSDGEIEGEEEVGKVVPDGALVLKGLPVPEGKHVRFGEDD